MSGHYVSKQISDHECEGERFGTDGFPIQCNDTPVFELAHSNGKSVHVCEYHIQLGQALHDTVGTPKIAENFDCLPEQLLDRVRRLASVHPVNE